MEKLDLASLKTWTYIPEKLKQDGNDIINIKHAEVRELGLKIPVA